MMLQIRTIIVYRRSCFNFSGFKHRDDPEYKLRKIIKKALKDLKSNDIL